MAEQLKDPESVFAKDGKAKICSDDEVSEGESDCED